MYSNDKQLGTPQVAFTGTTAELAALTPIEGMYAYDTTLDAIVYYDGANWVEVGSGSGTDADAIHDNAANEISGISEKTIPVDDDIFLIEDSEASYIKKKLKISSLPNGSGMENPMTTDGDIIYGGLSGTPTRLAAGTQGYYLKQGASAPEWAEVTGGSGEVPPALRVIMNQNFS